MTLRTYSQFMTTLENNTDRRISPTDVREIVETFSTQRTIGTYTVASVVTPTSFTTVPVTQFAVAITAGITWTSNYVTLRDSNVQPFEIFYRIRGYFSGGSGEISAQLVYGINGAAPTTPLPQSEINFDGQTNRYFTISDRYEIPAAGANTTIALQWKTDSVETFNDVGVFLAIRSLGPNYGGA